MIGAMESMAFEMDTDRKRAPGGRPRLAPEGRVKPVLIVFDRRMIKRFDDWRWQADTKERSEVVRRVLTWYLARPDRSQKLRISRVHHGLLPGESRAAQPGAKKRKRPDTVQIKFFAPDQLWSDLDEWCFEQRCNRSEGMRRIFAFAMSQPVMPPEIATGVKAN